MLLGWIVLSDYWRIATRGENTCYCYDGFIIYANKDANDWTSNTVSIYLPKTIPVLKVALCLMLAGAIQLRHPLPGTKEKKDSRNIRWPRIYSSYLKKRHGKREAGCHKVKVNLAATPHPISWSRVTPAGNQTTCRRNLLWRGR